VEKEIVAGPAALAGAASASAPAAQAPSARSLWGEVIAASTWESADATLTIR
jgi:hypothetical protein